jgi:hypothetical protein
MLCMLVKSKSVYRHDISVTVNVPEQELSWVIDMVAVSANSLRGRVESLTAQGNETVCAQVTWPENAHGPFFISAYAKPTSYGRSDARVYSSSIHVM